MLAAIVVSLLACGTPTTPSSFPEASRVPVGERNLYGVAWLRNGSVVVAFAPERDDTLARLGTVDLVSGEIDELPLPPNEGCRRQQALEPTLLADGRLGLLYICQQDDVGHNASIQAFDLQGRRFERLFGLESIWVSSGPFTVSPDLQWAVIAHGGLICEGLSRFSRSGPDPLPVTISDEGRSFRLDTPVDGAGKCADTGRAHFPTWSPDGHTIAFLGSPSSIGRSGQGRLDADWNVYLLDATSLSPRRGLGGIHDASGLRWSPDGTRLAFAGKMGSQKGTWTVNPVDNVPHLISSTDVDWLAWSPDGTHIAGTERYVSPSGDVLARLMVIPVPSG
jgi:hypothetical protein